jgi:acetyl esterase/lipase
MSREIMTRPAPPADERIPYGDQPDQFVDFRWSPLPGPRPFVVNIHGGFWRPRFDLLHAGHLCEALRQAGCHTANIEYRRSSCADILADVAAAVRFACGHAGSAPVVTGHSAGGHLALWLSAEMPDLAGVVVMGPVACLRLAHERNLGDGAVRDFLGATPLDGVDPAGRPSRVPRLLIHGTEDTVVPVEISRAYVAARRDDPHPPRLMELAGADHFDPIDPQSAYWAQVEAAVLG